MGVDVSTRWIEGKVDRKKEHIIIIYSDTVEDREKQVTYVMPVTSNVFIVQFLSSLRKKENKNILERLP